MIFPYSAYGLEISSDSAIPGLIESRLPRRPDLQIWLNSKPDWATQCAENVRKLYYVSPEQEGDAPALRVTQLSAGAYFQLAYADGATFVVDDSATRMWASWPESLTLEDAATYLLGPVLGFLLRRRGVTCLHASAVEIGGQAIALVGPAGAGKSTTAAAFALRGHTVVSDDVVPLREKNGAVLVWPGYPRVCLWPESVSSLYGSPGALPRLTPNWEKRYLPLEKRSQSCKPLSLGAIYFLSERSGDLRAPFVEVVAARAGLMALVENTYMNYLLDPQRRALEFEFLGRLVERVPLRRVTPHADPTRLPQLCDVLAEDSLAVRPRVVAAAAAADRS